MDDEPKVEKKANRRKSGEKIVGVEPKKRKTKVENEAEIANKVPNSTKNRSSKSKTVKEDSKKLNGVAESAKSRSKKPTNVEKDSKKSIEVSETAKHRSNVENDSTNDLPRRRSSRTRK